MPVIICLAIIALSVFLDQVTKYLTIFYIKPEGSIPLIPDVIHLSYVENTGAAFGMMKDSRWVFMLISTVAIVGILGYLLWKRPTSKLECLSLSFIVGGGIGNMIDRTLLGYVVDMIDFRLINFAVFNVADSFVCVGAGLMILNLILETIRESKAERAAALCAEGVREAPASAAEASAPAEAPEAADSAQTEETSEEVGRD